MTQQTIADLLDLPERIHKGDFVLNLSEGVTDPERTIGDYVVTPQLDRCLREALGFIRDAVEKRASKATYLHGSFGSGKSHFMAVLYLLLQRSEAALRSGEIASIASEHDWVEGKRFLLVPYHMLGANDMESAILGGYADHVRRLHPEAALPGVYLAEELLDNAESHRARFGDEGFFAALNEAPGSGRKLGKLRRSWDPETYESARRAGPGSDPYSRLVGALVKTLFPAFSDAAEARGNAFLSLDKGLGVISRHARDLGYDVLILFLDELVLWLASHAANLDFVHREGQKLVKLVESQTADRPLPIVSFIARQKVLRELVGDSAAGSELEHFEDSLSHSKGRLHTITLEDRNLPLIVERRLLRAKDDACRRALDGAFEEAVRKCGAQLDVILGRDADREMFRQLYPFSPALVEALVAISGALQRERTALRILAQILVEQGERIRLGEIVPVGDLWDMVAHDEESLFSEIHKQFELARRLYQEKLRPVLEDGQAPDSEPFRRDDRLVKTLLLATLVPHHEVFRDLTPGRLAALNHGSIHTLIPGQEGQTVLAKLKRWQGEVGAIQLAGDPANPTISLQVSEVDVDSIIDRAKGYDNAGNRQRMVKRRLFEALEIPQQDETTNEVRLQWRGTRRTAEVVFGNVRDLPDATLQCAGPTWRVLVDYPFDAENHTPLDDVERVRRFREGGGEAHTLVWLPAFFSRRVQRELGRLVVIEHLLRGDNLHHETKHLKEADRVTARGLLQSQQVTLERKLDEALESAYGIRTGDRDVLDDSYDLGADRFLSLRPEFTPQPPTGADLRAALESFIGQALEWQYPAHPLFEREVKRSELEKIWPVLAKAARSREPSIPVDKPLRPILRQIAGPLDLGAMGEDRYQARRSWRDHFAQKLAAQGGDAPSVADFRRWADEPRPRGLPRDVSDLLVLLFAATEDRSVARHGAPWPAKIGDLPDDAVLRPVELVSEEEWQAACSRSGDLFGVEAPKLLDAQNLERLACEQVPAVIEPRRTACERLPGAIQAALSRLGVASGEIVKADRYRTASAVERLVTACLDVEGGKSAERVRVLAAARIETSGAHMGRSLRSAEEVLGALQALEARDWTLFEGLEGIADERKPEADAVLADLREALGADQYVAPLAERIGACRERAVAILAGPPPPPPPPPDTGTDTGTGTGTGTDTGTGRQLVEEGSADGLDEREWKRKAAEITKKLREGTDRRITISWRIDEPGKGDA